VLVVNPTGNLARPAGTAHQTRTSSSLDVMLGRPALLLAVLIDDEERCAGRKNVQVLRNSITDPCTGCGERAEGNPVSAQGRRHRRGCASGDELGATRRPEFVTAIRDLHRRIPSERRIHPREPEAIDVRVFSSLPLVRCFAVSRATAECASVGPMTPDRSKAEKEP